MKQFYMLTAALLLFAMISFIWAETSSTEDQTVTAVAPKSGEQINWQVISSGGTKGNSTNFNLVGTAAQTSTGYGSSTNYGINHGFWQDFSGSGCCIGTRGSCQLEGACDDNEQTVDISDLTNMIDHLFISYTPLCCIQESDVAPLMYGGVADSAVDIADLTGIIDHLFISYTPMPPC